MNQIEAPLIRAWSEPYWGRISLLAKRLDSTGVYYGRPIAMDKVKDDAVAVTPTFTMDTAAAQVLMDDLWRCGLRPSEGSGSAGALAATQLHLDDMRRLVYEVLAPIGSLNFQFSTLAAKPGFPPSK